MHPLYQPRNIRRLWIAFGIVLSATVAAGFLVDMHGHFEMEAWPAFFALYGFIACAILVFGSKLLGVFLKRPETYYDR